jgi:hypothetical protein
LNEEVLQLARAERRRFLKQDEGTGVWGLPSEAECLSKIDKCFADYKPRPLRAARPPPPDWEEVRKRLGPRDVVVGQTGGKSIVVVS